MKSVLKYQGAKNRIANWIINYMPKEEYGSQLRGQTTLPNYDKKVLSMKQA